MHCSMCDAHLPHDAQFCIICGAAITPTATGRTQRLATTDHLALDPAMVTSAIIGFGYDTTEIAQGMTEVVAYGTAVIVEPESGPA